MRVSFEAYAIESLIALASLSSSFLSLFATIEIYTTDYDCQHITTKTYRISFSESYHQAQSASKHLPASLWLRLPTVCRLACVSTLPTTRIKKLANRG